MTRSITLAIQTLFSELEQQTQDADFIETFEKPGTFKKMKRSSRYYWYWQYRDGEKIVQRYAGPVSNKEITERVQRFNELKSEFDSRRKIVRSLISAGLPTPDPISGDIIEAMGRAGFFRLRGVLIGTTAYQCYSGILGVKLPLTSIRTGDTDLAQFYSISEQIDDAMPPVLEVLRSIDPAFQPVPHLSSQHASTRFVNANKYYVEFLTPNRGSDDYQGKPAALRALGGVSAEPIRFLDFLIREPMKSVLLHQAGVPVTIPSPERYAVHKLIVGERRQGKTKSNKDIDQSAALIEVMHRTHATSLSEAWEEAWTRGPKWKELLIGGVGRLAPEMMSLLHQAVATGAKRRRRDVDLLWPQDRMKPLP